MRYPSALVIVLLLASSCGGRRAPCCKLSAAPQRSDQTAVNPTAPTTAAQVWVAVANANTPEALQLVTETLRARNIRAKTVSTVSGHTVSVPMEDASRAHDALFVELRKLRFAANAPQAQYDLIMDEERGAPQPEETWTVVAASLSVTQEAMNMVYTILDRHRITAIGTSGGGGEIVSVAPSDAERARALLPKALRSEAARRAPEEPHGKLRKHAPEWSFSVVER